MLHMQTPAEYRSRDSFLVFRFHSSSVILFHLHKAIRSYHSSPAVKRSPDRCLRLCQISKRQHQSVFHLTSVLRDKLSPFPFAPFILCTRKHFLQKETPAGFTHELEVYDGATERPVGKIDGTEAGEMWVDMMRRNNRIGTQDLRKSEEI